MNTAYPKINRQVGTLNDETVDFVSILTIYGARLFKDVKKWKSWKHLLIHAYILEKLKRKVECYFK